MMTPGDFNNLVRKMRAAQKAYYAYTLKTWGEAEKKEKQRLLIESKRLESEVDKATTIL
jgi:hypothetical protein